MSAIREVFGRDFRREFTKQPVADTGDAMKYSGLFHREQKTGTILLSGFSFAIAR